MNFYILRFYKAGINKYLKDVHRVSKIASVKLVIQAKTAFLKNTPQKTLTAITKKPDTLNIYTNVQHIEENVELDYSLTANDVIHH
jgi:hypothetical protein